MTGALHSPSYGMTCMAGGWVIVADLWREQFVEHGRLVDAAVAPPIVAIEPAAPLLRSGLAGLDLAVRETDVGGLRVLQTAPRFATTFAALPRNGWTITASHRAERAADLIDGDASTSWFTGEGQTPGQWVAVDLGAPELLTRVDLLAIDWQNVPAGLRIEVSDDGRRWETVSAVPEYWGPLFFSEHHPFLKVRRGRVQAIFPPVRVRHLRVVQHGLGSPPHVVGPRAVRVRPRRPAAVRAPAGGINGGAPPRRDPVRVRQRLAVGLGAG